MKAINFLSTFLFVTSLHAEIMTPSFEIQCKEEFKKLTLREGFFHNEFREVLADKWNQKFYRSISNKIGEGQEVQFEPKKSPVILKVHDQQLEKITFNSDCSQTLGPAALPWHLEKHFNKKSSAPKFDDFALKQMVNSGKPAIIYSWSPKYAYSVYDIPRVKTIAEKLGYQFIAVVDPRVSEEEAREALKKITPKEVINRQLASQNAKKHMMANVSYELYFRGGFNHFPFTYVANHGKIHPRFIVGVMKDEGYEEMMKKFMKEL